MIFGALLVNMPTVMADAFGPEIDHTPVTDGTVGIDINITAKVTDVDDVYEVWLNYTEVSGAWDNVTMANWDDNYSFIIPAQSSAGSVFYNISANDTDTSDNWNRTIDFEIVISEDTESPEITHTPVVAAWVGREMTISAQVSDNVAVNEVNLTYTDVAGITANESMVLVAGNYNYTIPAQSSAGDVTYFIWANDTNDNDNRTVNSTIAISEDTDAPTITHTAVTTATAEQSITITATITDDGLGMESATLYYRKTGDADFTAVTMTRTDDTYTRTIPSDDVTTDGVEYYISATDGTNTATHPATNPTTSPHEITVSAADGEPTEELPWLWIIIAIIIIVIIIAAVAAAARGRGRLPEEELPEEELPEEELPEEESKEEEEPREQ